MDRAAGELMGLSIKAIAYAVVLAIVIGASLYVAHLYNKAGDFDVLSAEVSALEVKYGCDKRPALIERKLGRCLIARDFDAEKAHREEIERQREDAARAQAELDARQRAVEQLLSGENEILTSAPASEDGPVPKVLRDAWARERRRLGVAK